MKTLTEKFDEAHSLAIGAVWEKLEDGQLVIRNAPLGTRISKNGREYTPKAMENLRGLYNESVVFYDRHASSEAEDHKDLSEIAEIRNVTGDSEGNRGDIFIEMTHPLGPHFWSLTKKRPGDYGLSHEATNFKATGRGKKVKVLSVGGNKGFVITRKPGCSLLSEEEDLDPEDSDMTINSLEDLKDKDPDGYKVLRESMAAELDKESQQEELTLKNTELKARIEELESSADPKELLRLTTENETLEAKVKELEEAEAKRVAANELAAKETEVREALAVAAESHKRVLSEPVIKLILKANKDDLSAVLEESEITSLMETLPVLSEGPSGDPKPAPKGRAASSGDPEPQSVSFARSLKDILKVK